MQDDGFTPKELEQLQQLIPTIDQIQAVVREEIQSPETRTMIREEARAVFREENNQSIVPRLVAIERQNKVLDEKIDALATKDQEDSDALTSSVVDHAERIEVLENIHKAELAEVR